MMFGFGSEASKLRKATLKIFKDDYELALLTPQDQANLDYILGSILERGLNAYDAVVTFGIARIKSELTDGQAQHGIRTPQAGCRMDEMPISGGEDG